MRVLLVVSFFCLFGGLAQADSRYMLGRELMSSIEAEERVRRGLGVEKDVGAAYKAYGYIAGVVDSMKNIGGLCVPKAVSYTQLSAIVGKFLRANPERWGEGAEELVFQALHPVYRCADK